MKEKLQINKKVSIYLNVTYIFLHYKIDTQTKIQTLMTQK